MTKPSGKLLRVLVVVVVYLALLAVIVGNWLASLDKFDLYRAWTGYTPFAYVDIVFHPEHYAKDFMSGFNLMRNSALMRYFDLSYRWLSVGPDVNVPLFMAVEYLALALAMVVLVRTLRPQASPVVAAVAAMLVIGSDAVNMDFARYHWAFVAGYQNIPHALRILAIALMLQRRPISAGVLFGLAFASHPTMGLIGGVFAVSIGLSDRRNWTDWRYYAGGSLFLLIAGGWILYGTDAAAVARNDLPTDLWISTTKLLSFHLYPCTSGVFTHRHFEGITPFLSLMLLMVYYLPAPGKSTPRDRGAMYGVVAMLLLVAAAVVFSLLESSPLLIKLSLHRANDLIVPIALTYAVNGLCKEVGQGRWWRSCVACSILLSPFLMRPGFPLLWSVVLVLPGWALFRPESHPGARRALLGSLSILSIVLAVVYWRAGYLVGVAFFGGRRCLEFAILASVLMLLAQLPWIRPARRNLRLVAAFSLVLFVSFYWIRIHTPSDARRAEPLDYMAVQIWAEQNTGADSLFMIDPTICYGWRDYAQRSCFGNHREWLFTGIFYTSDGEMLEKGLGRARLLGVDLHDYLAEAGDEPYSETRQRMNDQFIDGFYNRSDAWRLDLASQYRIDYYVMLKERMGQPSQLPVAFENKHFVVLSSDPSSMQPQNSKRNHE